MNEQTQEPVGGMKWEDVQILAKKHAEQIIEMGWRDNPDKDDIIADFISGYASAPPPAPIKTEGEDEKNIAVVNALAAKIHDRMLWPAGGLDKYNAAIREVTIRAIIKGFEAGYAAKTKNTPNE